MTPSAPNEPSVKKNPLRMDSFAVLTKQMLIVCVLSGISRLFSLIYPPALAWVGLYRYTNFCIWVFFAAFKHPV